MAKGKRWNTPGKYLHKRLLKWPRYYRVGGGKNGKFRFKFFRHKKRFSDMMEGKVSMGKFASMELWFWD